MAALSVFASDSQERDNLARLDFEAQDFIACSQSKNTIRAYKSDWRNFNDWCSNNGCASFPADPQTVVLYLTAQASIRGMKLSTIKRRLYSIGHFHRLEDLKSPQDDPFVKAVMAGIRRRYGVKQVGRDPLLKDDLQKLIEGLPGGLTGIRDKAVLLLGFFSACRRSELVSLKVDDLEFTDQGLILHLQRSKTDQESEGREVGVPYASDGNLCPVSAICKWLEVSGISEGSVFCGIDRHGHIKKEHLQGASIALIIKRSARAAGIDANKLSAHSLRSGFCTEAAIQGIEERIIMKQTGHKSERVVRGYIREAVFQNNGATILSY